MCKNALKTEKAFVGEAKSHFSWHMRLWECGMKRSIAQGDVFTSTLHMSKAPPASTRQGQDWVDRSFKGKKALMSHCTSSATSLLSVLVGKILLTGTRTFYRWKSFTYFSAKVMDITMSPWTMHTTSSTKQVWWWRCAIWESDLTNLSKQH